MNYQIIVTIKIANFMTVNPHYINKWLIPFKMLIFLELRKKRKVEKGEKGNKKPLKKINRKEIPKILLEPSFANWNQSLK